MRYSETRLFDNISETDCNRMLACLNARKHTFLAEEELYSYDTPQKKVGILLQGHACIVRYEYNGSRTILEHLYPKSIFGEKLSFTPTENSCIAIVAQSNCEILFLDYDHITQSCGNACTCHTQLIRNLLQLLSDKTRTLSARIEVLSQRSIREKLMCYFMQLAAEANSHTFQLPFTMLDLADFLSVNRSAMIREIGNMKEDGLIRLDKRSLTLL